MEFIYNVTYSVFGIENIGLAIIVFTMLVNIAMIPLLMKQQKSMKINNIIQPEIQAIQKKYKGTFPAADGPGIVYDLTLYYQQDSDDGVYEMDATYLEAENGKDKTFSSTGKRKVKHGTPSNSEAIVYELIPSDGDMAFYFQAEGDSLTLLNQELQKAASDLNYTLILVP